MNLLTACEGGLLFVLFVHLLSGEKRRCTFFNASLNDFYLYFI